MTHAASSATELPPPSSWARCDAVGQPVWNAILLSLPQEEFCLISPHLEPMELPQHEVLQQPGENVDFTYFLNTGASSLVVLAHNGRSVEVGTVGKEGMVGVSPALGMRQGTYRAIMQMSGSGLRIRFAALHDVLLSSPVLRSAIARFALMHGNQAAQLAACNGLHGIQKRLARWLLICQDRTELSVLPLTHEFLAQMLGTGRPSVTLAAGNLESLGLIENLRGKLRILHREGLEEVSCECYRAIRQMIVGPLENVTVGHSVRA